MVRLCQEASPIRRGRWLDPANWALTDVANAQVPLVVEDLQEGFGDLVCQPWPETVTSAYLIPSRISGSSIQTVLVLGISPRLPFDESYKTFFHLVAGRITSLLESEIHAWELARAAKRFKSLAEADPFGMVIGDLHGALEYVNPGFLNTLGYSETEVSSGKVRWDALTPPEYADADARAVNNFAHLAAAMFMRKPTFRRMDDAFLF